MELQHFCSEQQNKYCNATTWHIVDFVNIYHKITNYLWWHEFLHIHVVRCCIQIWVETSKLMAMTTGKVHFKACSYFLSLVSTTHKHFVLHIKHKMRVILKSIKVRSYTLNLNPLLQLQLVVLLKYLFIFNMMERKRREFLEEGNDFTIINFTAQVLNWFHFFTVDKR